MDWILHLPPGFCLLGAPNGSITYQFNLSLTLTHGQSTFDQGREGENPESPEGFLEAKYEYDKYPTSQA